MKKFKEKTNEIRKQVDKKLLRLFNRAHLLSLALQEAKDRVELWTRILYIKNKVATSIAIIKRLSIKLK